MEREIEDRELAYLEEAISKAEDVIARRLVKLENIMEGRFDQMERILAEIRFDQIEELLAEVRDKK